MNNKDIFRSPLSTIKLLLKTEVIPYLIVDYDKDMIVALVCRDGKFYMCSAETVIMIGALTAVEASEEMVDSAILKATKLTLDHNIITDEHLGILLDTLSTVRLAVNSTKAKKCYENKQFTEDDFRTLAKLANEAKYDETYWSLEDD